MNILEIYTAGGFTFRHKSGFEYAGACPKCGGTDRFCLWGYNEDEPDKPEHCWCRQCGVWLYPDQLAELLGVEGADVPSTHSPIKYTTRSNRNKIVRAVPATLANKSYYDLLYKAQETLKSPFYAESLAVRYLKSRGITLDTAIKYGLGYIDRYTTYTNSATGNNSVCPYGIVIPNYRQSELKSLKIRSLQYTQCEAENNTAKYMVISGCSALSYILRTDERRNTPILIVESELDAVLLAQELGSLFNYIALGSATAESDIEISQMIESSGKVFFCPDYDKAGMDAFRTWQKQYSKIQLALLPLGKDPTEAFTSGVDLKQWGKQIRGLLPETVDTSRTQNYRYKTVESEDEIKSFLDKVKAGNNPVLSVLADTEQHKLAFSDGQDNTIITSIAFDKIDITGLYLVTFDPLQFRYAVSAPTDMPALNSVQYLYRALYGVFRGKTLRDMSMQFLGYRGGEEPLYRETKHNPEKELAGDARALLQLYSLLKEKILASDKSIISYYKLLCTAQNAIAQAMQYGLPVNWNIFEVAGGLDKAKDIAGHRGIDDRVRGIYDPCSIITGRVQTHDANVQGFPKDLRNSVVAPEGYVFVDADYKQSELRIAAQLAREDKMLSLFAAGEDIHRASIAGMLGINSEKVTSEQRNIGKAINFAFIYGSTPKGISKSLTEAGIKVSEDNCNDFLVQFAHTYPKLQAYKRNILTSCIQSACVKTKLGRAIPVDTLTGKYKTTAINYIVQGTGAELLLVVLSKLPKALHGIDAKVIHIAHDEILLQAAEKDAEKAGELLSNTMCEAFQNLFSGANTDNLAETVISKTWSKS